jgi:hypothetical protein
MGSLGADHFAPPTWPTSLRPATTWIAASMPLDKQEADLRRVRARLPILGVPLLVELTAVFCACGGPALANPDLLPDR